MNTSDSNNNKEGQSWVLPIDDDGIITFPQDMMDVTGWKEGDVLEWVDHGDQTFSLRKTNDVSAEIQDN